MQSGTILYAGTNLGLYGTPRFTLRKTAEPSPPQTATHWRVSVTVSLSLSAGMPATVWARARKLAAILEAGGRNTLSIVDENGTLLSWDAQPETFSSLTEAIARKKGQVEITFTALQTIADAADKIHATIDTLDGEDPLTIDRIMSWVQTARPTRPDERLGHRTEFVQAFSFSARASYADQGADTATRAAYLIAETKRFQNATAKEISLTFAGDTYIVQVESITATPSPGWEYLEIEAQARQVLLPDADVAEVQFSVTDAEDPTTGETRITLSGSIEADTAVLAENKIDALLTAYRTVGTRVLSIRKTDSYMDGADSAGGDPAWRGIEFQIELSRNTSATRYTLAIQDREGADGHRVTYSGSATAATLEILLATVATAAGGKHPVELSQELTVNYATDDEGTVLLVNATFSREYAIPATKLRGSVQLATSKSPLGQWQATLTGSISAPTEAQALVHSRSFIPAGVILRTNDEKLSTALFNDTPATLGTIATQISTVDFSYAWGTAHLDFTGISYTDATNPDYTAMVEERTITGQCHAPDKATAIAQVNALLTALSLSNPTKVSLSHAHERQYSPTPAPETIDRWLAFDFSYSFVTGVTGEIGHDIIRAEWSIARTGQVDHIPMNEVPGEYPVEQVANGYNIGTLTASGSCSARLQATARTWGQGKRTAVATFGGNTGAENPPDERMAKAYVPFSGTEATFHEFSFTYSFRYRTGLAGLWPSSGLTL